jgi:hypothetical protein
MSHGLTKLQRLTGVAAKVRLHALRHFHSTSLDAVISEAQKQARLGWSTVQMARHYTDTVPQEDRRAAEHLGRLLQEADRTRDDGGAPQGGAPLDGSWSEVASSGVSGRPETKRSTASRGMRSRRPVT